MARWKPWRCKDCRTTTPPISARGLCIDCAIERQSIAARQLEAHDGPHYEAWRKSMRELMPGKAHRF